VRAFVAIDVGEAPPGPDRGAPPHLTLRFLGEIAPERVGAISAALRAGVADVPPFDLTMDGVGAFPSRERPRVVWVGATDGADRARDLAHRVDEALRTVGFEPEREVFVPHRTLFRVRSARDRARAAALLAGEGVPPPSRCRVDRVVLKESELGPRGARHRTLAEFPLAGRPAPTG
jgi:RNA 2',3'-cyclic 3'-phosphodiesterase